MTLPVLHGDGVTLRPGTPDADAPPLGRILAEPAVARRWLNYSEARIGEELAEPDPGWVIEIDGAVAGWLTFEEEPDPDYRFVSLDLFLTTALHGRGHARAALRLVIRHFIARGHHRFSIDPAADNEPAIRAYSAVGFRPVGLLRHYERGPDGTFHDNLLMDLLAGELT